MDNETKDDKGSEKTADVAITEDFKDTNVNNKAVNVRATEDAEDAGTNKKSFVSASLKNALIMAVVALISVVFSFIFVSKTFSPREDNFEVQDVSNVSAVGRTGDVPQGNTNVKLENKKSKTDKADKVSAESGNTSDDISDGEEAGDMQDAIVVPMESIVVNLGGIGSNRYLRLQISLEVDDENAQSMVTRKNVILRDKMISFLSLKTMKDVQTEGGLFKLRLELKDTLNKLLGPDDIIQQIYFSDFIVQ